jgi:hypothetical protein
MENDTVSLRRKVTVQRYESPFQDAVDSLSSKLGLPPDFLHPDGNERLLSYPRASGRGSLALLFYPGNQRGLNFPSVWRAVHATADESAV